MLARYLQWLLTVEFISYGTFAVWGHGQGVLSGLHVGLFMLITPLVGRAVWVASPILYARAKIWPAASVPPLPLSALIKMIFREWMAVIRLFSIVQPFERRWMRLDRLTPTQPGRAPVVLVHGYRCNRGLWWWMRGSLEARGHTVATLNLEPLLGDIDLYAEQLATRIEEVCLATGAPRVALIGHSMGGLVSLAYLRRFGGDRVSKFIAMGTPFRGSPLAQLGAGRCARQMRPGNPWLVALENSPPPLGVEITTLLSLHDAYVPAPNAVLEGARVCAITGVAHLEMPCSEKAFALVCATLEPSPQKLIKT